MPHRSHIYYWNAEDGFGTEADVSNIRNALQGAGLRVEAIGVREPSSRKERAVIAMRRVFSLDVHSRLQIFLQHGYPEQMWLGQSNLVFPNYEHTHCDWIRHWRRADRFVCKTHYTQQLINEFGEHATYVGFSSEDEKMPMPEKTFREFLHVSGRSTHKGTFRLLEVWMRRPDWPLLTVTRSFHRMESRTGFLKRFDAPNIRIIGDYLPAEGLALLKNRVGIHLCLSTAEGFGHYIRNAMSTAAVVVTTDTPPMNEHITPETGLLVPICSSVPCGLGEQFLFDEAAFESSIDDVLSTPEAKLAAIGKEARRRFLSLNKEFPHLFGELLRELDIVQ